VHFTDDQKQQQTQRVLSEGGVLSRRGDWLFYTAPEGSPQGDAFSYRLRDDNGNELSGKILFNIKDGNGPSNNSKTSGKKDGADRIVFAGVPGKTYTIQYTESLENPQWQTVATRTADAFGSYEYVDSAQAGRSRRYSRSICP
jgi:hypothetical protein